MPRFLRQFGLRTLLLFCTLAAVCFGLWRSHMTWVDHQYQITQQIADRKGNVRWATWGPAWVHDLFGTHYFTHIVTVDWHHKKIHDEDMQLLREVTTLEELYVPATRISNAGIEVVADLPRLKRLAVWRTKLTDRGLETIGKLKNLEALDIHATEVTEKGFRHLRGLPKLKLFRHSLELTDEGVGHLATIPNIELEGVKCRGLSDASLQWVANQRKLIGLHVMHPKGEAWAERFIGHPSLQSLDVGFAAMTDEQLRNLLLANTLSYVNIHRVPVTDEGLALPVGGGKLRGLNLYQTEITPRAFLKKLGSNASQVSIDPTSIVVKDGTTGARFGWHGHVTSEMWPYFAECQLATSFTCDVCLPKDVDPVFLSSMKALENVTFHCPIDDRGIEALGQLPKLKSLILSGEQNISPAGYAYLEDCEDLESLFIVQGGVDDDDLIEIGKLKDLTSLRFYDNPITDDGLRAITSLRKLTFLELDRCEQLTDEAMRWVAKLEKLQTLKCRGSKIGDEGLKHLHGMPGLLNVNISGSRHTRAALNALRDSLPSKGGSFW